MKNENFEVCPRIAYKTSACSRKYGLETSYEHQHSSRMLLLPKQMEDPPYSISGFSPFDTETMLPQIDPIGASIYISAALAWLVILLQGKAYRMLPENRIH
jgi:hypothetical protein